MKIKTLLMCSIDHRKENLGFDKLCLSKISIHLNARVSHTGSELCHSDISLDFSGIFTLSHTRLRTSASRNITWNFLCQIILENNLNYSTRSRTEESWFPSSQMIYIYTPSPTITTSILYLSFFLIVWDATECTEASTNNNCSMSI